MRRELLAIAVLAVTTAAPRPARAEPSDRDLVYTGLALTPPTYFLGVVLHEGTHAVVAKAMGAKVLSIDFLPGRDPQTGAFHFGLTRVRGLRCDCQRIFFHLAPKLTDTVLLGGLGALQLADAWPDNRYGKLALTVWMTGLWVDYAKDVVSFARYNDVNLAFTAMGKRSELQRLPWRLLYAASAVGLGYLVYRGYEETFADPGPSAASLVLPVAAGQF